MDRKVRIAYIEDHRIVREGVSYLLSQYPNIEIVSADVNDERVEEFIRTHKPDVLILDLLLYAGREKSQLNGFEICGIVSAAYPGIKVIAHSMYDNVESVNKFFSRGGMGFVSKRSGHAELLEAIRQVARNKRYLCNEIVKKAKNPVQFLQQEDTHLKGLNELFTKTERNVLEKIAKGYSTKQIAQQLEISEKTVETHRKHLFDKAGVKNVAELIAFAYVNRFFMY
jgi:DNA-binding NarL/FixJ family response regulator